MSINRFNSICTELASLIDAWEGKLTLLSQEVTDGNRNSQDRTIKQIVGHMIDSATNNTHRIIHLQYQESPIQYPDYPNHFILHLREIEELIQTT